MRPADHLVSLHEVNKLSKSKATWSSIIPKWEVGIGGVSGGGSWGSRVGRRGIGQGLQEERRQGERKWTVNVKVDVVNGPDIR